MDSSPARQRFVEAAARLFAERGYAATSIADIQTAAGATAGSGALYKHFSSKQALLEAVVAVHLETMRTADKAVLAMPPADLESALGVIVDAVWDGMRRDRDVLRVLLRDLDAHPELLEQLWQAVRADVYDAFTEWLAGLADAGLVTVDDPPATAAVLVAALTYYPILDALIGHTPGDVDPARFRSTWIAVARATLATPEGHQ